MKRQEKIAEKVFNEYKLPSGFEVGTIRATVYEVEVNKGVYRGYEKRYGIEMLFEDNMLDGGKYEYEETVPVSRVDSGRIKALYIDKIKREEVFDSIKEMIFHHLQIAEKEVEQKMTSPKHESVEADSVEDKAQAALDSIEEMEELSD